jgi:hypothetical protein
MPPERDTAQAVTPPLHLSSTPGTRRGTREFAQQGLKSPAVTSCIGMPRAATQRSGMYRTVVRYPTAKAGGLCEQAWI